MMAVAVATGLVREARSKIISGVIGRTSGRRWESPKAFRKTVLPLRATRRTAPGKSLRSTAAATIPSRTASLLEDIPTSSGFAAGRVGPDAAPIAARANRARTVKFMVFRIVFLSLGRRLGRGLFPNEAILPDMPGFPG